MFYLDKKYSDYSGGLVNELGRSLAFNFLSTSVQHFFIIDLKDEMNFHSLMYC